MGDDVIGVDVVDDQRARVGAQRRAGTPGCAGAHDRLLDHVVVAGCRVPGRLPGAEHEQRAGTGRRVDVVAAVCRPVDIGTAAAAAER